MSGIPGSIDSQDRNSRLLIAWPLEELAFMQELEFENNIPGTVFGMR